MIEIRAVAKMCDRFATTARGASERRFNGFVLSEVRESLRPSDNQSDIIFGNCYRGAGQDESNGDHVLRSTV